jgi:hypothetical protein
MAHPLRLQDLRDAVLVHPRLVTVPKAVRCEPRQDRQPRRRCHIGSGLLARAKTLRSVNAVLDDAAVKATAQSTITSRAATRRRVIKQADDTAPGWWHEKHAASAGEGRTVDFRGDVTEGEEVLGLGWANRVWRVGDTIRRSRWPSSDTTGALFVISNTSASATRLDIWGSTDSAATCFPCCLAPRWPLCGATTSSSGRHALA